MGSARVKKEIEEENKTKKPKPVREEIKKEIKTIVRIANTDINGEKPIVEALKGIKGIGNSMSKAICEVLGLEKSTKAGSLTENDIQKIEDVIKEPLKFGIPPFLLNRRKDPETGKDLHLVSSELEIRKKFDIQKEIELKTYRGIRHMYGLPVRGQRTRSSFRKGKVVGVMKKAKTVKKEEKK